MSKWLRSCTLYLAIVSAPTADLLAVESEAPTDTVTQEVEQALDESPAGRWDIYFGVFAPYVTIGGPFDGQSELVTEGVTSILPRIEGHVGLGAALGIRSFVGDSTSASAELSYCRTWHDYSWTSFEDKVTIESIGGELQLTFHKYPVHPLFFLGGYLSNMYIENGAADTLSNILEAMYSGFATNVGVGLNLPVHNSIWLSSRVAYRRYWYYSVVVDGEWTTLADVLKTDGLWLTVGIYYGIRIK